MYNSFMIPAALLVTLVITLLFSLFSKRPVAGLWLFFLIIFLATWAGQLWIRPIGPVTWGVSWVPLIVIGVFFALLVQALTPGSQIKDKPGDAAGRGVLLVLGAFLWIILIIFVIAIVTGYYRSMYHFA